MFRNNSLKTTINGEEIKLSKNNTSDRFFIKEEKYYFYSINRSDVGDDGTFDFSNLTRVDHVPENHQPADYIQDGILTINQRNIYRQYYREIRSMNENWDDKQKLKFIYRTDRRYPGNQDKIKKILSLMRSSQSILNQIFPNGINKDTFWNIMDLLIEYHTYDLQTNRILEIRRLQHNRSYIEPHYIDIFDPNYDNGRSILLNLIISDLWFRNN